VPTNIGGRSVLNDFGKRVHHRLQRIFDQYREVIGPRRRPFDPRVTTVIYPIRRANVTVLHWCREHRVSDNFAPDGHLMSFRQLFGHVATVIVVVVVVMVVVLLHVIVCAAGRLKFSVQILEYLTYVRVARTFSRRELVVVLVLLKVFV